jgi:hypothetical protein
MIDTMDALAVEPTTTREFSISDDRCDRCGAQAFLAAQLNGHELLFCNHHGRRFRAVLQEQGFVLFDNPWTEPNKLVDERE